MMRTVCRNLGIQVGEPVLTQLRDDRTDSYVGALKQQYHNQVVQEHVLFLLVFILSRKKASLLVSKGLLYCVAGLAAVAKGKDGSQHMRDFTRGWSVGNRTTVNCGL